MLRRLSTLLLLSVLALTVSACASHPGHGSVPVPDRTPGRLYFEYYPASMTIPAGWREVKQEAGPGVNVVHMAPPKTPESKGVSVVIQATDRAQLDDIYREDERWKAAAKRALEGSDGVATKRSGDKRTINNYPVYLMRVTVEWPNAGVEEGAIATFYNDHVLYRMTYRAPKEVFERWLKDFTILRDSFKVHGVR